MGRLYFYGRMGAVRKSSTDHPARQLIVAHKKAQFARVTALFTAMPLSEPEHVAQELTLLMEGAQVVAQNKGIENIGERLILMVNRRLGH
jgi:hypothetical protein